MTIRIRSWYALAALSITTIRGYSPSNHRIRTVPRTTSYVCTTPRFRSHARGPANGAGVLFDNRATDVSEVSSDGKYIQPLLPSGETVADATVMSSLGSLWRMTRPSNYLGVVLFHLLGTQLGLSAAVSAGSATMTLSQLLLTPSHLAVLLSLLLTSGTSMMVNDYYDNRKSNDLLPINIRLDTPPVTPPPRVVKRAASFLYALLLLTVTVVPGSLARLCVVSATMTTFLYTEHLKPLTWIKNMSCALIIGLAPLTSAAATLDLLLGSASTMKLPPALIRVTLMLFLSFWGRELTMDINDAPEDDANSIPTVPVVYSRKFASRAAAGLAMAAASVSLLRLSYTGWRQFLLSVTGCAWHLWHAWGVVKSQGEDSEIVEHAVEGGKLSVLLWMASFL
uniref:Uncharacterized protein n=1 Tax=Proboscia inermis TaxID=420281 RepID=A0A7S0CFF0_9STRA|mmetsp:Transcript_45576/g.46014  ORF Transcript_45576/g.46014 Transcript_45576/m.46014 type:complete len:395 (+) Transcript_45576:154-1338(+)